MEIKIFIDTTKFEETAELCEWTEVQKVIYAKRLLKGSAKLFSNFECEAKSWNKLKKALAEEFATTLTSKEVHRQLSTIRKKSDESYQEYIYRALEISSHADIEIEAKIQYIVEGVPDAEGNKSVLYGAETIKELRKKFAFYETQVNQNKQKQVTHDKSKSGGRTTDETSKRRCYNCGDKKHIGKDCPHKTKGVKCFACGEFGHLSNKCTKNSKTEKSKARVDATKTTDKKTYKPARLLVKEVVAVIDPGSDLHLARVSLYRKLGEPRLDPIFVPFDGLGSTNQFTLGRFTTDVSIDGITFNFDIDLVPDESMGHDLLIGGELSDYAEVRFKRREAFLTKLDKVESVDCVEAACRQVLKIDVRCNNPIEDTLTEHIKDPEMKIKVTELIENYKPEMKNDTGVKMRILLKEEKPIHQSPRRLSAEQNSIANNIILGWIKAKIARASCAEYASPIVLKQKKDGT